MLHVEESQTVILKEFSVTAILTKPHDSISALMTLISTGFRFATQEKTGLLLYNGRFNEEHDFVGLEIVDSQVTFTFSLGGNHSSVSTYIPGGVSTGQWFPVTLHYHKWVSAFGLGVLASHLSACLPACLSVCDFVSFFLFLCVLLKISLH